MEVYAVKNSIDATPDYPGIKSSAQNQAPQKVKKDPEIPMLKSARADKAEMPKDSSEGKDDKEPLTLSRQDVEIMNEALNNFMKTINSTLHFRVHEDTGVLMMQVVDRRDDKVIKEIPSQEMLDVIARIRESVGAFLDERA